MGVFSVKALLVGIDSESEAIVGGVLRRRGHEPIVATDGTGGLDDLRRERRPSSWRTGSRT